MRLRALLVVMLLGPFAGCSGESGPADETSDTGVNDATACPPGTRELNFGPEGLTSAPNSELNLQAYLVEASARPPVYGPNDWTIQITDLDENSLDANLLWACAYMPAHAHGSNPKMVEKLGPGRFELLRQNMSMEGSWEIRLWIDPTGGGTTYEGGRTVIGSDACLGPTPQPTITFETCVPG